MSGIPLGVLAERLQGRLVGDPDRVIAGVRSLSEAGDEHLAFYSHRRYREALGKTEAGALLVAKASDLGVRDGIVVANPYLGFAKALAEFHPEAWPDGGVSERAEVADDAVLGAGVRVEAFVVIGEGVRVGEGSWIQSGVVLGAGVTVGAGCRLMPNAVVMPGCELGDRVWINPGAVIGGEGFGFVPTEEGWHKIPQVAGVRVGADVEIGSNACVDRGALETTQVGAGTKLDNLVQVGHGAVVGERSAFVAFSGVAGSTRMGAGVTLAARTSVLGHLEIGDGVTVGAHSMVSKDAPGGSRLSGVPAQNHRDWLREQALLRTISDLTERVAALESRLNSKE